MADRLALVTGATGAVGPALVRQLVAAGYHVRTFSLTPPEPGLFPAGVEVHCGDITGVDQVAAAVSGVDTVFHLAALLHIVDPPLALRREYERVNLGGTQAVIAAAGRAGVRRVVFFSTIAVYGYGTGRILTEASACHPESFYAQTKLAAEGCVLAAANAEGQPLGTVLRMSAIYGARLKGNYLRLLTSLSRGRFIPVGAGRNRRTLVYDRDAARAALLAAGRPSAAGQVYNVTDGGFHTLSEIIRAMSAALGRRPPRLAIPLAPVSLAARTLGRVSRLLHLRLPLDAALKKYTEDAAIDGSKIRADLGFSPVYTLSAGWQAVVQELRRAGKI